jgi:hypothetical protein
MDMITESLLEEFSQEQELSRDKDQCFETLRLTSLCGAGNTARRLRPSTSLRARVGTRALTPSASSGKP